MTYSINNSSNKKSLDVYFASDSAKWLCKVLSIADTVIIRELFYFNYLFNYCQF